MPNEDLAKMLKDAQRMVKEMENRNFTSQKTAAEKERDEAEKCKLFIFSRNIQLLPLVLYEAPCLL